MNTARIGSGIGSCAAFARRNSGHSSAVLEGIATKTPYALLGEVVRDLSSSDIAITNPADPTITLVVIPWADEDSTFSIRYIGDLDEL